MLKNNTVLIADSGGTKTIWAFVAPSENIEVIETKGIQPYFQDANQIRQIIEDLPKELKESIAELYYYGAGCGAFELASKVESVLVNCFPKKAKIEVHTDVLGAARALCQHSAGIAAILGTGSNTCYYNGENIVENSRGFGFILGDEGSGAVMGKQLIVDFLYRNIPSHLLLKLKEKYRIEDDTILENVYQKPAANRYLAQFSYFIHEHRNEPYIQQLLKTHFEGFFRKRVLVLQKNPYLPLHLSGSIAFHFQAEIKAVAAQFGIEVGTVLQNPIERLIHYHL
ncbi:MAG: BadF/BadG/BcrA/BcrD ATPase family protein [Chitinophagales bacterium]